MKRRLAAILCADVVGYSAMVAEDEEDALRRLLAYREVFDEIIKEGGGRIFNTAGDAVLAEFPSAVNAVRAAIDIQESLRTRNLAFPPSRQMLFRIGITIGDVVEQKDDLLGDAVNIAARLETLAAPGGICLSQTAREQVSNKLSAQFRDIGLQNVKNIPNGIHAVVVEMGKGHTVTNGTRPKSKSGIIAVIALGGAIVLAAGLYIQFRPQITLLKPVKVVERLIPPQVSKNAENIKSNDSPAKNKSEKPGEIEMRQPASPTPPKERLNGDNTQSDQLADSNPGVKKETIEIIATPAPPSILGRVFNLAEVPFISESGRRRIGKAFGHRRKNRTLAINTIGDAGFSWSAKSVKVAKQEALEFCNKLSNLECEIYAIGDTVVWDHPEPKLPPRPWVKASASMLLLDVTKLTMIKQKIRTEIREKYIPASSHKAIAVSADGAWSYTSGRASEVEAMRMSLQACAFHAGEPCRIVILNMAMTSE